MKPVSRHRTGLLGMLLLLALAGCTQTAVKPSKGSLEEIVALRAQAEAAYRGENWTDAEKAYRALTQRIPAESENWFRLGNVYARLGRHYDAIALYREALVRDPKNSRAWHNLGVTQLRVATNTFEELQQHTDPSDPVAERARRVVDSVIRLLQEEFNAALEAPAP
jgi:tetratricopeptide (TPR) repeat protein